MKNYPTPPEIIAHLHTCLVELVESGQPFNQRWAELLIESSLRGVHAIMSRWRPPDFEVTFDTYTKKLSVNFFVDGEAVMLVPMSR